MNIKPAPLATLPERKGFVSRKIPGVHCPQCGVIHDGITDTGDGEPPKTDDIVICIKCCHVNQFNEDGTLRCGSEEAYSQIPENVLRTFRLILGKEVWYTRASQPDK